jgi:hypothetical protein
MKTLEHYLQHAAECRQSEPHIRTQLVGILGMSIALGMLLLARDWPRSGAMRLRPRFIR